MGQRNLLLLLLERRERMVGEQLASDIAARARGETQGRRLLIAEREALLRLLPVARELRTRGCIVDTAVGRPPDLWAADHAAADGRPRRDHHRAGAHIAHNVRRLLRLRLKRTAADAGVAHPDDHAAPHVAERIPPGLRPPRRHHKLALRGRQNLLLLLLPRAHHARLARRATAHGRLPRAHHTEASAGWRVTAVAVLLLLLLLLAWGCAHVVAAAHARA